MVKNVKVISTHSYELSKRLNVSNSFERRLKSAGAEVGYPNSGPVTLPLPDGSLDDKIAEVWFLACKGLD